MTSTDLLRIVERLNLPWPSESWWSQSDRDKVTLANHATALVELVRACEEEFEVLESFARRNGAAYPNTAKAIERVLGALAAVHAVKVQP